MSNDDYSISRNTHRKPYKIIEESLTGTNISLKNFFFKNGANVYVFTYENQGAVRHTVIDSGDIYYQKEILKIFVENNINLKNIERIIITHGHGDHYGLAYLLARESGAKILVHQNFQRITKGEFTKEEKRLINLSNIAELKKCNFDYLPISENKGAHTISGSLFSSLIEPISIGDAGKLELLACPPDHPTHTPDQLVVLYSLNSVKGSGESPFQNSHLADNMIFSGDLWLMRGPQFDLNFRYVYRRTKFYFFKLKALIFKKEMVRPNAREQDPVAKEALKTGFCLIRVKPGHGEEFIGSRIIPNALLSDRDIIVKLGYSQGSSHSILKQKGLAEKIAELNELAYKSFVKELLVWRELGYSPSEVTTILVRIYKEQSDGSAAVRRDRKERRERLKETLTRLKDDEAQSEPIRQLAVSVLSGIKAIG